MDFNIVLQDQYGKFNKVPEWQRLAGKAAKEVEKFAKEKVDLVLMHWRDRMGIAQKEVKIKSASKLLALLYVPGLHSLFLFTEMVVQYF